MQHNFQAKSIYVVLEDLRSRLSVLNITLDLRYEALGKYVANTPGFAYTGYTGCTNYSEDYTKLLSNTQETLKKVQALEAVIETLAKEVD